MDSSIPQDDLPRKQCSKCLQFFPATPEFFNRRSRHRDELNPRCNACRKEDRKIYNDAHKEESKRYAQAHKEEIRIRQNQYRDAHKEEIYRKKRHYREEHREHDLAKSRYYHATHREVANKRRRQRRIAHLEEERTQCRHYRASHLEEERIRAGRRYERDQEAIRARQKQDRQARPDVHRARARVSQQSRRARKRRVEGTLTLQQIQGKLKAQKYACYYAACGHAKFEQRKDGTYMYHLDHVIPVSRPELAPRHDVNNVVLACPHCNQSKGNKPLDKWTEGGRLF